MARKKQLSAVSQLTEKGDGTLIPENCNDSSERATAELVEEASLNIGMTSKRGRVKRRKCQPFKVTLESILSMVIVPETVPKAVRSTPLGDNITYQEAILIAQILKATTGDTQASTFIRDTSGNKLKEKADESRAKLEDLILK